MLENLHVKNLALIDEIEVDFQPGLNILTGETGAGKSILLGSVNLALGGKYSADMLRTGAKFGLVELTFTIENEKLEKQLEAMDIYPEDGRIVLNRKLMEGRSVSKINGETVNMTTLREVACMLIDIHEQHVHQSLLHKRNHLVFLDLYAKDKIEPLKEKVAKAYHAYTDYQKKLENFSMDERERQKEISLAEFEIHEIEEANLQDGEDEDLEQLYQRMASGKKITEAISEAYQYTSEDSSGNASDYLSRAIRALQDVSSVDEQGMSLYDQLSEIDSLLNDFNRELSDYAKSFEFSEEDFYETENRLNIINRLKTKFGAEEEYMKQANALTMEREKAAIPFVEEIKKGLKDLNFLDVQFEMRFTKHARYGLGGMDDAEFYMSTNPGEALKPMGMAASGGELSRIMLVIKTILAGQEDTPTLIFDEIDTGISGITAGKVAEKMRFIGKSRQVLCITHLAQIASKADAHYLIQKQAKENVTKTEIIPLSKENSIHELARLLGGDKMTASILESAKEMKELAMSEI